MLNISKRTKADNGIIKELQEKYPKVSRKGVEYDLGLTYFTFETDYFSSPLIRRLIKEYSAEIVSVICFFRAKMCQPYGWYTRVDGFYLEELIEQCAFFLKLTEETVKKYYDALIERQVFFVVSDEKGSYLTDLQQIFNFEILNNTRIRDRERKAKKRGKIVQDDFLEAEEQIESVNDYVEDTAPDNITIPEAPSTPVAPTAPVSPDYPEDDFGFNDIESAEDDFF